MQLDKIIKAARGDHPVDLLLKNVNLINVLTFYYLERLNIYL